MMRIAPLPQQTDGPYSSSACRQFLTRLALVMGICLQVLQPAWGDRAQTEWQHYGDLLLRYDRVERLPDGREFDRLRSRARLGVLGHRGSLEWAAAAKLALGSDSNSDNRRNLDNERSNAATLDELFLRWVPDPDTVLTLGKSRIPLNLSPMVWDDDLRPAGVSLVRSWEVRDFDRLRFAAISAATQHLYGDRSLIHGAQLGWMIHEGAERSASLQLALLQFNRLHTLVDQGLARTNRRAGDRLLSDFRLLDLQAGAQLPLAERPLALRVNLLRNLEASDLNDAARISLAWGRAEQAGEWQLGYAQQRIQRDAVVAAFNDDDWWFHSAARGGMPWLAVGLPERWQLRVSGFSETRDGLDRPVRRLLLDVRRQW